MRKVFFFVCLISVMGGFSQELAFSGTINDAENKLPLPYVNIGIRNKNIGTISDENGRFSLGLTKYPENDTITFSFVGYFDLTVPINWIVSEKISEYFLKRKVIRLPEYEVIAAKSIVKKFGCTSENSLLGACNDSTKQGDIVELGQLIKIGNKPARILSAHIFLKNINFDTAIVKINFYKMVNDLPGERLSENRIIRKLASKNGWLSIDIEQDKVLISEDFIMTCEFIPTRNTYQLCYGAALGFGTLFFREVSHGKWKKIPPVARLSMYVTAMQ